MHSFPWNSPEELMGAMLSGVPWVVKECAPEGAYHRFGCFRLARSKAKRKTHQRVVAVEADICLAPHPSIVEEVSAGLLVFTVEMSEAVLHKNGQLLDER